MEGLLINNVFRMNSESVANDKNKLNLFGVVEVFCKGEIPKWAGQVDYHVFSSKKQKLLISEKGE